MPVSIVAGGQYGSEGKGKVALEIVRRDRTASLAVRVGGPNSGHTAVDRAGVTHQLRQIPAAAIDRNVQVVIPATAYVDPGVLLAEIAALGLARDQVLVSPHAHVITDAHRAWEARAGLVGAIGSTGSGTGAAVLSRVARGGEFDGIRALRAEHHPDLAALICPNIPQRMRAALGVGERIVVEGSQGFGLALSHSGMWPKATSRETTVAGFLMEAGLGPKDVDDATLVLRCHPIRVAGESGDLVGEMTWEAVAHEAGIKEPLAEFTTVTKKLRRVGRFDAAIVCQALANCPADRIVLNHLDYVDPAVIEGKLTPKAKSFVSRVEEQIGRQVDWLGISPSRFL